MDEKICCDYFDGDETDERLKVERLELSPYLPKGGHIFDGMHFDEWGVVLVYCDGSNQYPKTYEMRVVFSSGFHNIRVQNDLSLFEDNKLWLLQEKSGEKEINFWAFRCKYTNYFNWCVRQSLNQKYLEEHGYHYILAADCMWIDVFSAEPPRVFFDGWGMNLPEKDYQQYPVNDVLYDYPSSGK